MFKIGIIGIGKRGGQFLNSLSKLDDIEISFICDRDMGKLKEASEKYKIVTTILNYKDAKMDIDGIIIATPSDTHFEIAKFFLERKIPVLLEKPSTYFVEETETLFNISKRYNIHLHIGYSERYNPSYLMVKNFVDRNSPTFIEATRINQFSERTLKVDVILDLMIHDIDIIINLLQVEPVDFYVFASTITGSTYDFAKVIMRFKDGVTTECTANRLSDQTSRTMTIYKTDFIYKLDFVNQSLTIYTPVKKGGNSIKKDKMNLLDDFVEARVIKGEFKNLIIDEFYDFQRFIRNPEKYNHKVDLLTLKTVNRIKEKFKVDGSLINGKF